MPATSATTPAVAHTSIQICFSGMPIDSAAAWSSATARKPRPTLVCENSSASTATMMPATAAAVMSSWLMSMPVLSITQLIGSSRMPRSRRRTSTPHASCADAFDDEGKADRGHQQRVLALVHQRTQDEALGRHADEDHQRRR